MSIWDGVGPAQQQAKEFNIRAQCKHVFTFAHAPADADLVTAQILLQDAWNMCKRPGELQGGLERILDAMQLIHAARMKAMRP